MRTRSALFLWVCTRFIINVRYELPLFNVQSKINFHIWLNKQTTGEKVIVTDASDAHTMPSHDIHTTISNLINIDLLIIILKYFVNNMHRIYDFLLAI